MRYRINHLAKKVPEKSTLVGLLARGTRDKGFQVGATLCIKSFRDSRDQVKNKHIIFSVHPVHHVDMAAYCCSGLIVGI